jgi:hypothetical protein
MKSEEIAHIINDWPMDQKEDLRTEVLRAIEVGRRMKFSWDQTSAEAPSTDIVWPPDNAPMSVPVSVTFRSPKRGIQISEEEEGTDTDVVIQSAGPFPDD